MMVLNFKDLAGFSEEFTKLSVFKKSKTVYEKLSKKRKKRFAENFKTHLKHTSNAKDAHNESLQFLNAL